MKIRINIGDNGGPFMVLPLSMAGQVAEIMAHASVFERDGWNSPAVYKRSEHSMAVEYVQDGAFTPLTEREKKAEEAAGKSNTQYFAEYNKRTAAEKRVAELEASLAAIQSVTVCRTVDPEPADIAAPNAVEDGEVVF